MLLSFSVLGLVWWSRLRQVTPHKKLTVIRCFTSYVAAAACSSVVCFSGPFCVLEQVGLAFAKISQKTHRQMCLLSNVCPFFQALLPVTC